jgi:probable HAF family extracellular repeat protein
MTAYLDPRAGVLCKPLFLKEISMQRRHFISLSLLPLTLAVMEAASAGSYPEYRVTIVGPANSRAADINNAGVVVGTYPIGTGGINTGSFINRGSGVVNLGTLGGQSSQVVAINDKGQVLGNRTTTGGQQRGFIYYHGKYRDLGSTPGIPLTYIDINNAGYTVAIGPVPVPEGEIGVRSFLRDPSGHLRNIGTLPGENPVTQAEALNNRNQIVGESGPFIAPDPPLRAFLWTKGVMRDLGDFGFTPNYALGINDRGQVTGYASVPTGFRNQVAFIYSNGRLIDIDRRPPTASRFSTGDAINNLGHVVGYSNHLSGFVYRGHKMESLNALVDPKLGWNIQFPRAINDKGQIAADAVRGGVQYAVRLDPIRPYLEAAPVLESDEELGPVARSGLTAAQEAEEAGAEVEAQAKEVVKAVGQ